MYFCGIYTNLADKVYSLYPPVALFRQRSIFPGSCPPSIVDAKELNYRVRYGNGWDLLAMTTGY